ncbi:MAG: hypothetical protein IJB38_05255 [Bacteroidales bacterium]|nr:hypothetical protein [Bacteroidales bacterium]
MQKYIHILIVLTIGAFLSGCNIYSDRVDGASVDVTDDGMRVSFAISAGHPDYSFTKSSYDTPSLEDGTEWENFIDIAGNDYLFYLFDGSGIFREILNVTEIKSSDSKTYLVKAETREVYQNFTIVALANWRTGAWDMISAGTSYPILDIGSSTIDEIWNDTAGLRVYDSDSRTFTPSATDRIPMYGARSYNLPNSAFNTERIDLGNFYLIRSLAKIDVYVSSGSGITINSVRLNCYSNCFHCAPIGMKAMDDEWDQATDETMNTNLTQESFSPSSLEFVKIEENLFRLYVPEYPNKREGLTPSTISVSMTKNGIENGGTIHFEGMELPSSTEKTRLNILRNNYYKFCIKGVTDYNTDTFIEVVPFDDVNNDIVFE